MSISLRTMAKSFGVVSSVRVAGDGLTVGVLDAARLLKLAAAQGAGKRRDTLRSIPVSASERVIRAVGLIPWITVAIAAVAASRRAALL
jgi:hypothetical protein